MVLAGLTWGGAVAGRWWGLSGAAVTALLGVLGAALVRRALASLCVVFLVAGAWAGVQAAHRHEAVLAFRSDSGRVEHTVRLVTDPRQELHGWWALAVADPPESGRPPAIPMLLSSGDAIPAAAGEGLAVTGVRTARAGTARGDPYSGVVRLASAEPVQLDRAPWWTAGNAVRARTLASLMDRGANRALLAGFLVGETSQIPDADLEAMRRSGLSHLVAVSGSNVALFITMTLLAAGPLAAGPRRRAVVGLVAIVILVVATRWEPSVMRASVMAGILLAGRIGGWAPDAFSALAVTVVTTVVVAGDVATDVGFTLSVLATLGVVVGGSLRLPVPRAGRASRYATAALGATVAAQIVVAPVLLVVFGSVPLMAPVTNLLAAPVVSASTALGAVGVATGFEPLIETGAIGAAFVLAVARLAAGWPQLGWAGVVAATGVVALTSWRRLRPAAALVGAVLGALSLVGGFHRLEMPSAVALDVGQGDAVVVMGEHGAAMLIDGGPDPSRLEAKLASYGINSFEVVVLTHAHADHAAGLEAVLGRRRVGELWVDLGPHATPSSERVLELAMTHGIPVRAPPAGWVVWMDGLAVEVLGPLRRYDSANDESLVLRVGRPGGPRLLLTGDIEKFAQADLGTVEAEVLKVPHHGADTSDGDWLAEVGADLAVITVGDNDFGHPAPEVVEVLSDSGAQVRRTDVHGDVVIPLR